jgi:hypothetical protein
MSFSVRHRSHAQPPLEKARPLALIDPTDNIYIYIKKAIWHLAIWQNCCLGQFHHSKIEK